MLGVAAGEVHAREGSEGEGDVPGSLLRLAKTLRRGEVRAGFLLASQEVSGFRCIQDPDTASLQDLRRELAAQRERLENALIIGDIATSPDLEEASQALANAAAELVQTTTQNTPGPILGHLANAADRLIHEAETSQARIDLSRTTAQLTVATVGLWSVAERLLGVVEA